MKPLREIWADILEGLKDAFIPAKGTMAYRIGEGIFNLLEGHEAFPAQQKIELWEHMAGIETEEERDERKKAWVKTVRNSLIEDGVSETSLGVFDAFVDAKWPTNSIAASFYWSMVQAAKLASTGLVIGAEAAYEMARDLTPARPDESMAWRMAFADKEMRPAIIDALKDRGWSDDFIASMEKAHRRYTEAGDSLALLRRGEIDEAGFFERLAQIGFDARSMVDLKALKDLIPSPPDLVRMALREAFRDDVAAQWAYDEDFPAPFADWMEKQGFTREWAKYYWRAHWVLPSTMQGFEMRHRDVINDAELEQLLRISDIPRKWRENLTKIAYRPLTRVDVRRMHDMGVLDEVEVKRAYKDLGYDEPNATRMMDFTIAYNDRTADSDVEEFKDLTRSVVVQAYKKGLLTYDQAETRLMALEYNTQTIKLLLDLADWQQDVEDVPGYTKEYKRDIKGIVEKAYAQRVLSHSDATDMLIGVGLSEPEATYILIAVDFWWGMDQSAEVLKTIGEAYVKRAINRADALDGLGRFGIPSAMMQMKMSEWDIQRGIRSRRLTEAQYRRAMDNEIISVSEYEENLRGLGYTEYDIWVLTAMAAGIEEAGAKPASGPL